MLHFCFIYKPGGYDISPGFLNSYFMDKYDIQIEELTRGTHSIVNAWSSGRGIFKMIGEDHKKVGCLTMIRNNEYWFVEINGKRDDILTEAIRNDERIPKLTTEIKPSDLQVFAEWQRKVDKIMEESKKP